MKNFKTALLVTSTLCSLNSFGLGIIDNNSEVIPTAEFDTSIDIGTESLDLIKGKIILDNGDSLGINGAGNGGDICESSINTIRDDIKLWIKSNGHQNLSYPEDIKTSNYKTNMLKAIEVSKIACTNKALKYNGAEKTCVNFKTNSNAKWIVCNSDRLKQLSTDDKYKIIHHEYAGVAGIEVNKDEESDYTLSNQISAYLEEQVVKRLAVKQPFDLSQLKRVEGSLSVMNFNNLTQKLIENLGKEEFSLSMKNLDKVRLLKYLKEGKISSREKLSTFVRLKRKKVDGKAVYTLPLFRKIPANVYKTWLDKLKAEGYTYNEAFWASGYNGVAINCAVDKEEDVLILDEDYWRNNNSTADVLSCLLATMQKDSADTRYAHYDSRYSESIGYGNFHVKYIENIISVLNSGKNHKLFKDLNVKKLNKFADAKYFVFTNESLLDANGYKINFKYQDGMILMTSDKKIWNEILYRNSSTSNLELNAKGHQILFHELLRLAYFTFNDESFNDDDYSISRKINEADFSIVNLKAKAKYSTVLYYEKLKPMVIKFSNDIKSKKNYKWCGSRHNKFLKEISSFLHLYDHKILGRKLDLKKILVGFNDQTKTISLTIDEHNFTIQDGIELKDDALVLQDSSYDMQFVAMDFADGNFSKDQIVLVNDDTRKISTACAK
jgi:hypothetical protein